MFSHSNNLAHCQIHRVWCISSSVVWQVFPIMAFKSHGQKLQSGKVFLMPFLHQGLEDRNYIISFRFLPSPKYRTWNLPWRQRHNWGSRAPEDRDSPIYSDLTRLQFPTKGSIEKRKSAKEDVFQVFGWLLHCKWEAIISRPEALQTSWPSNQAKS